MGFRLYFFTAAVLFFSVSLAAIEPNPIEYWMCKNNDIIRTVRIEKEQQEEYVCYTAYSKAGSEKIIGRGRWTASCQRFLKNIVGNLKEAGWECRSKSDQARIYAPKDIIIPETLQE